MIAVVGAGHWGKNHVKTLNELGRLSAIVDSDVKRLEEFKKLYPSVTVHQDLKALIGSDIKGLVIATPAPTHFEIAKQAMQSGFDVLVEKPLVLSSREAEELLKVSMDTRRILMVGHLLLYQPAIGWMKEFIQDGKLGALKSVHQVRMNLGKVRSTENVLWSFGEHDIAVINYFIGEEPSCIAAEGQRVLQPKIEDDVYLHLEFPSGCRAHMHVSWLWPVKERGLTLIGTEGMLTYNEIEQTVMWHKKTADGKTLQVKDDGAEIVYRGHGEPLRLELEHFISCIQTRRLARSGAASGVTVTKILEESNMILNEVNDG